MFTYAQTTSTNFKLCTDTLMYLLKVMLTYVLKTAHEKLKF